jgi:pyruvate/2-oxoglutarate dehydrogenase complex dihydrolipoamide acyltransferase (E2) component
MSLESKIEELTAAVAHLTQVIVKIEAGQVSAAPAPILTTAPAAAPAPAPVVEAPVAAPVMPAPPTFAPPVAAAPAPVVSGAPFADNPGLLKYVMAAYQALGPTKGAEIQKVLTGLGYQNINDVKPEHYAAFHAGVEALKGGA